MGSRWGLCKDRLSGERNSSNLYGIFRHRFRHPKTDPICIDLNYLFDSYKPLAEDDTFLVRGCFKTVEFKVVKTSPGDYITVTPSTQLMFKDKPVKREDDCAL